MIKNTRKAKTAAAKTVSVTAESVAPAPIKVDLLKTEPRPTPAPPIRGEPVVKAELAKPQAPATPPPAPAGIPLEFVKPDAKQVCVAGSFNEWQPDRAPLKAAGNGRWIANLNVKPGRYEYLFVVDGQWLPDPNAKETVQNPFGGRNSVLTVSA